MDGFNRRFADGRPDLKLKAPQVVLVFIVVGVSTGEGEGIVIGAGWVENLAAVIPPCASLLGSTVS